MIASTKKITIVGATGLIGRQLTPLLREAGHDVTEASRASGTDLVTGEGLDVALTDADVVVDVINSATPDDSAEKFFKQTSANLSAGYIRGKLAQESAAAKSGIPWTVVRATQFHELAEPITESLITGEQVRAPKALIQTIDSKEVTAILARIATGSPFNAIHNLGGPQKMTFADMARAVLVHQSRELEVIDDPAATYQGLPVDNTTLVTDDEAELGTTRLSDWLALH